MTAPLYGPSAQQIDQYQKLLGVDHVVFNNHPGVLQTLANAKATDDQVVAISQFVRSLELAKQVKLARLGGAALELNDQEKQYLSTIAEPYDDVDYDTLKAQQEKRASLADMPAGSKSGWFDGPGAFLGHLAQGGSNALFGNPVSKTVLHGLDRAADTTRGVVRMAGVYVPKPVRTYGAFIGTGPSGAILSLLHNDSGDSSEVQREMRERGYDPGDPISTFAFFSRGEQNYHDLTDLREKYGAENVRFAQQFTEHPELFDNPDMADEQVVRRIRAAQNPDFQRLVKLVNSRHMSSGRDYANALGINPDSKLFTAVSGPLDAVESWFVDPTIIGGKVAQGVKFARRGIDSMTDANGIKRVMTTHEPTKRGWQMMLDDAKIIREGDDPAKAAAYARIRTRTPDLVPVVPEINGHRYVGLTTKEGVGVPVFEHGAPIENLDELTTYLVDMNALVRMGNGLAAQRGILMPGAVSRWAAIRWGRANVAGYLAAKGVQHTDAGVVDYAKDASKVLASPGDDAVGAVNEMAQRGEYILSQQKHMRSAFMRTAKRISTVIPTKTNVDYYSAEAPEQVRRFASLFMPKSEASLLAAKFTTGDMATKRTIYKGMFAQMLASAGLDASISGSRMSKRFMETLDTLDKQKFSTVDGLDQLATDSGTRNVALWLDQMNESMWLPSFAELHRVAAKVSLYDHVLRKPLESELLDKAMGYVKAGWLMTPSNALRNAIDEDAGVAMRGMGPQVLRARLALTHMRSRSLARAEIPEGERPRVVDSVSYWTRRSRGMLNWAKAGILSRASNDELEEAAQYLGRESSQDVLGALDGLSTAAIGSTVVPRGADEVQAITKAGYRPGEARVRADGYGLVPTDGGAGLRAWSNNLGQRFTGDRTYGLKILGIVRNDTPEARESAIDHLLKSKRQKDFRDRAEIAKDLKNPDATIARAAAAELVDKQVKDLTSLVTDKDGNLIESLANKIESDDTPSIDWLTRNVPADSRPEHAVGRKYVAMDPVPERGSLREKGRQVADGYGALTAGGYELFVSKPVAWLSRHPIYMVNYAQARRNLKGYRNLLEQQGMKAEVADETMHRVALQHAFDETLKMVDNPEVQSQFSVLSRGFFAFERAAEDWARRWGRAMREDPSRIQKAHLAFEGGVHSGVIDRDDQGNPRFVYPGSGAVIQTMLKVANLLPGVDIVQLPTMPDLHSSVMFLNPALDNPVQLSLSPVAAMPLRVLQHAFPMHALGLSNIDTVLNGQLGAGRTGTFESFLPTFLRRPFEIMTSDDKDGQVGSAARNAILNLSAAGKLPGQKKDAAGNPIPPTESEILNFLHQVKVGAMNQLVARAILALVLPAAPSLPENATGASKNVDKVYAAQGLTSVKEEYRVLVNKYGIDRATAIWTELHPDQLAYTVAGSKTGGPYQYVSPTDASLSWMEKNLPLLKKYRSIGAYFVPTNSGEFSQPAWNAMFEIGVRENKDLREYFTDVASIGAEQVYYATKERKDTAVAEYKARGDDGGARAIREAWTQWSQNFLAFNPVFAQKQSNYGAKTEWRKRALADLSKLVGEEPNKVNLAGTQGDPVGVDLPDRETVRRMIAAYRNHSDFTDRMRNKRDMGSVAAKDSEQTAYDAYQLGLVGDNDTLMKIYNGLFRGLD